MREKAAKSQVARDVRIPAGKAQLEGELIIPEGTVGMVLLAHGSSSSRHNRAGGTLEYFSESLSISVSLGAKPHMTLRNSLQVIAVTSGRDNSHRIHRQDWLIIQNVEVS